MIEEGAGRLLGVRRPRVLELSSSYRARREEKVVRGIGVGVNARVVADRGAGESMIASSRGVVK